MLFNVIPIGHGSRVDRAAKRAVEKLGGDGIMEVTVHDKWWWAGIVFGNVATVEGRVFRYIDRDRWAAPKGPDQDQGKHCAGIGGVWSENSCVFVAD